jgi:hypothetical protein
MSAPLSNKETLVRLLIFLAIAGGVWVIGSLERQNAPGPPNETLAARLADIGMKRMSEPMSAPPPFNSVPSEERPVKALDPASVPRQDPQTASPGNDADFSAGFAVHMLRSSLRDPDSLVLEHVYSRIPVTAICIEYRAKNGFGGVNRERAAFYNFSLTKDIRVWNRQCAGSGFREISLWNLDVYERLIESKLGR